MIDPSKEFHFDVISQKEQNFGTTWTVPKSSPYFDGHFPNHPILPAVAILDASIELIKQVRSEANLTFSNFSVSRAKFIHPIVPAMSVDIKVDQVNDQEWHIRWLESSDFHLLASFNLSL